MHHFEGVTPHATLIQAFDPVRFEVDRQQENTQVMIARTDVFLNILFGREIILPAGQIAESPAMFQTVTEVLSARETVSRTTENSWQPFKIALEPEYDSYSHYVDAYRDIGTPMVLLPLEEQKKSEYRQAVMQEVQQLYLERKFDELEKRLQRDGYAEYARLVSTFLDESSLRRPNHPQHLKPKIDLLRTLEKRRKTIADQDLDRCWPEIEDAINFISSEVAFKDVRGLWYANQARFGAAWDLVRFWLDTEIYHFLAENYAVDYPSLLSQDLERGRYAPKTIFGCEGEVQNSLPGIEFQPTLLDWKTVWEVVDSHEFQRSAGKLASVIRRGDVEIWKNEQFDQHAEFLSRSFSQLQFNLERGKVVLTHKYKQRPATASAIGGALTTGSSILLGSIIPGVVGSMDPALLMTGAAVGGAALGGAFAPLISHEVDWLNAQKDAQTKSANSRFLNKAKDRVSYWSQRPVRHAPANK